MIHTPSKKLFLAAIFICIGASTPYAYFCIYPNTAINVFRQFLNESHFLSTGEHLSSDGFSRQWSFLLSGTTFIGALLGTPLMPVIADSVGRKGAVIVSFLPLLLGAVLQMLAFYWMKHQLFGVGQFFVGISMSIGGGSSSIYLSECAPAEWRGFIGTFEEITLDIVYGLGMLVGLPYILGKYEFRYILIGLPLAMITFIIGIVAYIPESPKHLLIAKRDQAAARDAIKFFNGEEFKAEDIIAQVKEEEALATGVSYREGLNELWTEYRLNLALGVASALVVPFSGIVAISQFSTEFFLVAGYPSSLAEFTSLGLGALNFMITILTLPLIERVGRRPMLLCSCAGVLLFLVTFITSSHVYKTTGQMWASYVAAASILMHMVAFNMGAAPISLFYTSEVVPYAYRSIANAIVSCVNLISITVTTVIVLPLYYYVGAFSFLLLYVGPMTLMFLFLFYKMPETKQKTIADIVLELKGVISSDLTNVGTIRK